MSEVTQIEAYRASQVVLRDRRAKIERLLMNKDFKEMILHGFCRDDAARYIQEAGDPLLDDRQRADAMAIAMSSGHLKRYLAITMQMGATAVSSIAEADEALVEARAEEDQAQVQALSQEQSVAAATDRPSDAAGWDVT